jgi:hypothetical protein
VAALAMLGSAAVGSPTGASGGVEYKSFLEPDVFRYPTVATYTLRMTNTGDREERFSVSLEPPRFRFWARGPVSGALIDPLDLPELHGPGRIVGNRFAESRGTYARCSSLGIGDRGYEPSYLRFDVALPSRTSSDLVARNRAGVAPWRDSDYRLVYSLGRNLLSGGRGTIPRRRVVRSPQPRVRGRVRLHVRFTTSPRSAPSIFARRLRIALGRRIAIRGRTTPRLVRGLVALRYVRRDRGRPPGRVMTIVRLRTDRRGRFRHLWLPPSVGTYELWAVYRGGRRALSEQTCPRAFAVR